MNDAHRTFPDDQADARLGWTDYAGFAVRGWWIVLPITLIAIGAALYGASRQAPTYRARTTFLVAPAEAVVASSNEAVINTIGSLARTTMINTFAQIASSRAVADRARERVAPGDSRAADVRPAAVVLPDTFAIEITVEAPDPGLAAALADSVRDEVGQIGIQAYPAFQLRPLDSAVPPTAPSRPQPLRDASLAGLAGLLLGLLIALAVGPRRRRQQEASGVGLAGARTSASAG